MYMKKDWNINIKMLCDGIISGFYFLYIFMYSNFQAQMSVACKVIIKVKIVFETGEKRFF